MDLTSKRHRLTVHRLNGRSRKVRITLCTVVVIALVEVCGLWLSHVAGRCSNRPIRPQLLYFVCCPQQLIAIIIVPSVCTQEYRHTFQRKENQSQIVTSKVADISKVAYQHHRFRGGSGMPLFGYSSVVNAGAVQ